MSPRICLTFLAAWLILPASSAVAGKPDSSSAERSGSMRAEIRQILDPPRTGVGGQDASNGRDPSLDYYYSKLPGRTAGSGFSDPYAAPKNPRGTKDSSYVSKKPPKQGQIPEPGAGWLVVAGAVGLILFGRRRAR